MLRRTFVFFILLALIPTFSAQARVYILIDEASQKKFPIAVPAFRSASGGSSGIGSKMSELVKKDLQIAGLFQVLDEDSFAVEDRDPVGVDFKQWKSLEAQALVKGIVNGDGTIEIRLYDIAEEKMILGKRYTIDSKTYIDATHRFVDSLMKALTGTRGPFDSKIVASCGKTFKRTISSFDPDGSRRSGLTGGSGNHISPSWAPDGGRVTYISFQSKFPEVHVSGRQVTHLQTTCVTPVFNPNGSGLIASCAQSGDSELYSISMSGNIVSRLTNSTNIDLAPSLSPDGSRIVFSSERAGGLHLFVMSANGGGAERLTYTGYQNDQADWSPDGTKIVFSGRDRGAFDIFVMDSDGANIQRLTRGEGNNESPTWSPDSRYISYSSTSGGLHVMLQDGTTNTVIEKTGGCINSEWGPWLSKDE